MTIQEKINMAYDISTSTEVLTRLAGDDDWEVRGAAAKNKRTPTEVLERLTEDEIWQVREGVAENVNAPVELLTQLAKDENRDVRSAAAVNEKTPVEMLRQLARDESWKVRRGIARNKNTPVDILTRLAGDKDREVQKYAAEVVKNKLDNFCAFFDFSYSKDIKGYRLIDNQGANLGDIEGQIFDSPEAVIERFVGSVYFDDYITSDLEEAGYERDGSVDSLLEWCLNNEDYKNTDSCSVLTMMKDVQSAERMFRMWDNAEEMLVEKIENEYNTFITAIKKESSDVIVESAYEISTKDNIRTYIGEEQLELTDKQIEALLASENTLNELFDEWIHTEYLNSYSDVAQLLEDTANAILISQGRLQSELEYTDLEKAFLNAELDPIMAKSVLAWDEIEDLGYIFYENEYIDKHSASDKTMFGNGISESDIYALADKMRNGEDIRADLAIALLGNQHSFETPNGHTFDVTFNGNDMTAKFGNAERSVSYEAVGNAFLKLFEDEYKDIVKAREEEEIELNTVNKEKADELFTVIGANSPIATSTICYDNSMAYTMANVKYPSENSHEKDNGEYIAPEAVNNELETAKKYIEEFHEKEYGEDSETDFSDLSNIGLAYTTLGDNEEHQFQVTANLIDLSISYSIDGKTVRTDLYDSLADMIEKDLSFLDFDYFQTEGYKEVEKIELDAAKKFISEYSEKHLGTTTSERDFENISNVFCGYSEIYDDSNNVHQAIMTVDLYTYTAKYFVDDEIIKTENYNSLNEMNEKLLSVLSPDTFEDVAYSYLSPQKSKVQFVFGFTQNDTALYYTADANAEEKIKDIIRNSDTMFVELKELGLKQIDEGDFASYTQTDGIISYDIDIDNKTIYVSSEERNVPFGEFAANKTAEPKTLAQKLDDFMHDYDTYGYMDNLEVGETREDAVAKIEADIENGKVQTYLPAIESIISDNDEQTDIVAAAIKLKKEITDVTRLNYLEKLDEVIEICQKIKDSIDNDVLGLDKDSKTKER